jgi:hypothetical protein
MATYTVTGHPLNPADLASTVGGSVDPTLLAAMRDKGVGATFTATLAGSDDTKAKAHKIVV